MMPSSMRVAALLLCATSVPAMAQQAADPLLDGFRNPSQSARPRVWWHWMNGNITVDGIDKDLDWLASVGIGGVQNFDANLQTPQIVKDRLPYMTPGWKAAFAHAVKKADALGMEFAVASSPGWSETGGPWVKPEDGMKRLVWVETTVAGGKRAGTLPTPPANAGAYQNATLPKDELTGGAEGLAPFYRDVRVLAWPEAAASLPTPKASDAQGAAIDGAALGDESLTTTTPVPTGTPEKPGALVLDYGAAVTVRSARLYVPGAKMPFRKPLWRPVLEAEVNGAWQAIAPFDLSEAATTISFPATTARRFRLVLVTDTTPDAGALSDGAPGAIQFDFFGQKRGETLTIGQFQLFASPRVDHAEAKAGFTVADRYGRMPTPAAPGIDPASIIDITSALRPDGTLDWTAPKGGTWHILRLGYGLTGTINHPATPEATGLEVDKYDAGAVRRYLETYLAMVADAAGPGMMGARGIRAMLTDSIEVGPSNWTPDLIAQFTKRRGYDPLHFLPTMAGHVVGDAAKSDAFLSDLRQTLAELIAEAHYGTVAKVAHEHGLVVYGEALENGRPVLGDDLAMRSHADVPMAALWAFNKGSAPKATLLGDIKGAASVAHIYGQNVVAAESMTSAFSPWAYAPADLKRVIDTEFVWGVNRPVIHTSVHQPVDDKVPGLSLMIFGQYFNRHESWAGMARPWVDYMARTGYLLQQGRNHADIAYFYGDEAPITALFVGHAPADLPRAHAYDMVNAAILADVLKVENGALVAPSGARYQALYLGQSGREMRLATLRRIAELVDQGATLIGAAPVAMPSASDAPGAFDALVARLWNGQPVHGVGKGRVIVATNPDQGMALAGVAPDVSGAHVPFVHRKLSDGDLYFITNSGPARHVDLRLGITGRDVEIWRATDASTRAADYRTDGAQTVVPLELGEDDALFILLRHPASAPQRVTPAARPGAIVALSNPWQVTFQSGRGAPASMAMPTLKPLNESADAGVRYFSGLATYATHFALPKDVKPGAPLPLDLGKVGDLAEVFVNGKSAGITWQAPYALDIGKWVKAGDNRLEVRVANVWVNRLIGDVQPNAQKVTFTAAPTYVPNAPLRAAGLIGPVTLSVPQR